MEEKKEWAAHTPASLERQTLRKLVKIVLESALPNDIARIPFGFAFGEISTEWGQHGLRDHPRCGRLDQINQILMATKSLWPQCLKDKKAIIDQLQNVRQWWDDGLNSLGCDVARVARQAVSLELQLIDPHGLFPLMGLILQLLFSSSAGTPHNVADFPFASKTRLELHRDACPAYASVLQTLAPFKIEEISTKHIIFGDVEPWITVVKGSPNLQRIHLKHNADPSLLTALRDCTRLHTFILEEFCGRFNVPVDILYRMFFMGKDHKEVSSLVSSQDMQTNKKILSFPSLKLVDLGNNWDSYKGDGGKSMTELRYNLLYFYPNLQSLSCENMQPFKPIIPSNLPPHCHNLSYNLTHVDLYHLLIWVKHKCSNQSLEWNTNLYNIVSVFKHVRHLTLTHASEIMQDLETVKELADFTKMCLPELKCRALTLSLPFTFPPTTVNLLEYLPIFDVVGGYLRILRLHLSCGMVAVGGLYPLLACCPNLEVLGLMWARGAAVDYEFKEGIVCLPHLISLSVIVQDGAGAIVVESVVESLLKACPTLSTLELVLPHRPCEWLMTMADQGVLNKIRTLRLSFRRAQELDLRYQEFEEDEDVGLMFYVPFIELLPSLEVLLLGYLPLLIYRRLSLTFISSGLRILPRAHPLTHTLHPYL